MLAPGASNQGVSLVWNPQLACGMESDRRSAWNHHKVMHGIKTKEDARWRVMPCRREAANSIHRTSRGDAIPILRIG